MKGGNLADALQALTQAAERFVKRVPISKKRHEERMALQNAIAEANRLLKK